MKSFATLKAYENVISSVGNHVGENAKRAPDLIATCCFLNFRTSELARDVR